MRFGILGVVTLEIRYCAAIKGCTLTNFRLRTPRTRKQHWQEEDEDRRSCRRRAVAGSAWKSFRRDTMAERRVRLSVLVLLLLLKGSGVSAVVCGDGLQEEGEQCEDGNTVRPCCATKHTAP